MKKTKLAFLVLALVLCLTGCQLAKADIPAPTEDRLVGVFVTAEHLDLFDMDAYLNDNIGKVVKGGDLTVGPDDATRYGGRVYGEFVRTEEKDMHGEAYEAWDVVFPGITGLSLMAPTITEDGVPCTMSIGSPGISARDFAIHSYGMDPHDTALTLEGTIYVDPALREPVQTDVAMFVNPVYQTSDGQIYLTEGQGISSDAYMDGEISYGQSFGTTREETWEVQLGEDTETAHTSIKVTLVLQPCSAHARVYHMNQAHEIVKEESLTTTDDLYTVALSPEAEYLIVEVEDRDGHVLRSLCNENGQFELFVPLEDGLLSRHEITAERRVVALLPMTTR